MFVVKREKRTFAYADCQWVNKGCLSGFHQKIKQLWSVKRRKKRKPRCGTRGTRDRETCESADCFRASSLEPRLCGVTRLPRIRDLGTRRPSLEPSLQAERLNIHKDCRRQELWEPATAHPHQLLGGYLLTAKSPLSHYLL